MSSAEELRAALESGEHHTIVLENDITTASTITITGDIVLDLNGHDLVSDFDDPMFTVDGGQLNIRGDGSIQAKRVIGKATNAGGIVVNSGSFESLKKSAFQAIGADSTIYFNDGEIHGDQGGIDVFDGASCVVNGGLIEVSDNFAIASNGTAGRGGNTIVVNDGTLIGHITDGSIAQGYHAIGVYIANNDVFIMNGGRIEADNGTGLLMRGGLVEIHDGTIVATGEAGTEGGYVGDNKRKVSKSAVIYDEAANYPGKDGMQLTITGGTFIGVDHSLEILSNEETPNVVVEGGSFEPAYPEEQGA